MIDIYDIRQVFSEMNEETKRLILSQPEIDAVPVVHGTWIKTMEIFDNDDVEQEAYGCSNCSRCQKPYFVFRSNYCPNCGAKMDEKENEK